jgi:hypothetical protein
MFRAQQNAFDDVVRKFAPTQQPALESLPAPNQPHGRGVHGALFPLEIWLTACFLVKATDENLTSENWEYIMVSLPSSWLP